MSTIPYIITTTTPYGIPRSVAKAAWKSDTVTRRAVATLDEAREVAVDLAITQYVEPDMRPSWAKRCRQLSEFGGTIGPLPDGTVIEVAQVTWLDLLRAAFPDNDSGDVYGEDEIIETFNADAVR